MLLARGFLRLRLRRAGRLVAVPPMPASVYRAPSIMPYEPPADVERMPPAARVPDFDVPVSSTAPMTIPAEAWERKEAATLPSPPPEPVACCPSCNAPLSRRSA